MKSIPISPFLPMHENILMALSDPNRFLMPEDPDELEVPYLDAMLDAGWLEIENPKSFYPKIIITKKGLQQLEIIKITGI